MSDQGTKKEFDQTAAGQQQPVDLPKVIKFTDEEKRRIQQDALKGSGFGTEGLGRKLPPFQSRP